MKEYSLEGDGHSCDNMTIRVHQEMVEFIVGIDGCGNTFQMPIDSLQILLDKRRK